MIFSEPGQRGSLTMVCTCSLKVKSSRVARPRPETTCPFKATPGSRVSGREDPSVIIIPIYYNTITRWSIFTPSWQKETLGRQEPRPPWLPAGGGFDISAELYRSRRPSEGRPSLATVLVAAVREQ